MAQQIHIASFQGVLAGNVQGSSLTINNFDSVNASMREAGVPTDKRQELERLLEQYQKTKPGPEKEGIAKRAGAWLQEYGPLIGGLAKTVAGWFGSPEH